MPKELSRVAGQTLGPTQATQVDRASNEVKRASAMKIGIQDGGFGVR